MENENYESKAKEKNDFQHLISDVLSKIGFYQIILGIGLSVSYSIIAINNTLTSFHTYTPSFYCADYNITDSCDIEDQTCPSGFVFDNDDDFTLISQWSLICSQRLLAPLINTLYFVGTAIGAPIFGFTSDKWGRRLTLLVTLHIQGLLGAVLYFVNSYELFLVIRIFQGIFVQGLQQSAFTIIHEYAPPNLRTIFQLIWDLYWCFGLVYVGFSSYFIRNWQILQLVISIPSLIFILYIWFTPESIQWLLAHKKQKSALYFCGKVAKFNKQQDQYKKIKEIYSDDSIDWKLVELTDEKTDEKATITTVLIDVFRTPCLRKNLLTMIFVWFSVTLAFYGILFFLPELSVNRHWNFLSGAAVEFVAAFGSVIIYSKFGRRNPFAILLISNGIILLILGIISISMNDSYAKDLIISILANIGKGCMSSCFSCMWIYACELLPTTVRSVSIGICGLSSRTGSLIAPYIIILAEYTSPMVPLVIMGVSALISGITILFLPETLNKPLVNTVTEAKGRWEKS